VVSGDQCYALAALANQSDIPFSFVISHHISFSSASLRTVNSYYKQLAEFVPYIL